MGTQEIIISDPKRNAVDSTIFRPIPTGNAVGFLEGTVQALNELLERTEFFRHFIVICKTDDLGDEDVPILFELKLLGSQFMGRIVVIGIHERPYEDSLKFCIVVYHGV